MVKPNVLKPFRISFKKMSERKLCYIWDDKLIEECDRLPAVIGRASMVQNLIAAYKLFEKFKVIRSVPATFEDMVEFHSDLYLKHLKTFTEVDEEYMTSSKDEDFGIGYDCPPVSNMYELVSVVAGGSVTAAKSLLLGVADVAINWCGGWHHAHRQKAEGFCYINDIVIAIEKLKQKFGKILYIDLDVHHGNGVQDAYNNNASVFTLSFHKYEPGFYPGSGDIDDIGTGKSIGYQCNFPLKAGYCDDIFEYTFNKVFASVYKYFSPEAIVVQCGADALAQDPYGGANLTPIAYRNCVRTVLDKRKPTLLLGGGGYNFPNVARLWAILTADLVNIELDEQIPEHSHWPQYGPTYTIDIQTTLSKDCNEKTDIDKAIETVEGNLQKYLGYSDPPSNNRKYEHEDLNKMNSYSTYRKLHAKSVQLSKILLYEKDEVPNPSKDIYEFED